jgi:hypothetical protein
LVENTNIYNKNYFVLPKSAKTHVRTYMISKISPGVLPPDPFKQGRGREGRGEGGWEGRRGGEEERWVEGWEGGRERRGKGRGRGMYASIHQGDQRRWFFHCSK